MFTFVKRWLLSRRLGADCSEACACSKYLWISEGEMWYKKGRLVPRRSEALVPLFKIGLQPFSFKLLF